MWIGTCGLPWLEQIQQELQETQHTTETLCQKDPKQILDRTSF